MTCIVTFFINTIIISSPVKLKWEQEHDEFIDNVHVLIKRECTLIYHFKIEPKSSWFMT